VKYFRILKAVALTVLALLLLRYAVSIVETLGNRYAERIILPIFIPKNLSADFSDFAFYICMLICTSEYMYLRQTKKLYKLCIYAVMHIFTVVLLFICRSETLLLTFFLLKSIILTAVLFEDIENASLPHIGACVVVLSYEWLYTIGAFAFCISF
jgi:hypothetical protein